MKIKCSFFLYAIFALFTAGLASGCKKDKCLPAIEQLTIESPLGGALTIVAGTPWEIPFTVSAYGTECEKEPAVIVPETQALLVFYRSGDDGATWEEVRKVTLPVPSFPLAGSYTGSYFIGFDEPGDYRVLLCVDDEGIVPDGTGNNCF